MNFAPKKVFLIFFVFLLLATLVHAEPPPIPVSFGGYIYKNNDPYAANLLAEAGSGAKFESTSSETGSYALNVAVCGGDLTENCINVGDALVFRIDGKVVKTLYSYEQGANRLDLYLNEENKIVKESTEKTNIGLPPPPANITGNSTDNNLTTQASPEEEAPPENPGPASIDLSFDESGNKDVVIKEPEPPKKKSTNIFIWAVVLIAIIGVVYFFAKRGKKRF